MPAQATITGGTINFGTGHSTGDAIGTLYGLTFSSDATNGWTYVSTADASVASGADGDAVWANYGYGSNPAIITAATAGDLFSVTSVRIASWGSNTQMTVTGYLNGVQVSQQVLTSLPSEQKFYKYAVSISGVDKITFAADADNNYAMDDLVVAPYVVSVPTATATAATSIGYAGATLNGTVSSNNGATTVTFKYGTTASYGSTAAAAQSPLGATATGTSVSAALTGLACNTTYHYAVYAVNSAGNTTSSDATFTTSTCVPGAPTGTTATAGDGQASVSFTAPGYAGASAITGYTVSSNPVGGTDSNAGSTGLSHTITGLINGTAYTFTVVATNSYGNGGASTASAAVTPKAVQTITFANPGAQNFGTTPTLTATASSNLTPTFTSSTTGVCTITSAGALTFVTAGSCTIKADQAGNGSYLAAPSVSQTFAVNAVAPGAPTISTVTAGNALATVNFAAPSVSGGSAITGYTVTSSPGNFTANGSSSPLTVTGLTNGTAYTFTVTATNGVGTGTASAPSSSVTPKGSQTITFANPGAQNFGTTPTLAATASSSLTPAFSSSTTGVCTITSAGALTFVSAGTCTINADQPGNGAYLAAPTVSQTFTVSADLPSAPTIGAATAGDGQAVVSFSAPASNGGSAITGYTVTSSPGGLTASGSGSPLTVTGLSNGTAYTFTVTATNGVGTGAASAPSAGVTPKASQTITFANPGAQNFGTTPTLAATASSTLTPTFTSSTSGVCTITSAGALTFVSAGTCTINADQSGNGAYLAAPTVSQSFSVRAVAPGVPTIGVATAGAGQASVSFSAPSVTGGASITSYIVTSNPGGLSASGAASPIVVTGLTNGTAYTFSVKAVNSAGTGLPSAQSNSITPVVTQTISFANPGAQNFGTTPTLTASASSTLAVTFSSSTTGVCTVSSGGVLTFIAAGTCTINADQSGNGSYLAAATVTQSFAVNAVVPGAPTIGTATAGNATATVSFTAPSMTGGAPITGYTVTSSDGQTATGTASPITMTGLVNGRRVTFTVKASNAVGTGPASAASNGVVAVDDPPVAMATTATVAYSSSNNPIALNLSGGRPTSVAIFSAPAHGQASVLGTNITYTPTAAYVGTDSFTYIATNSGGSSAAGTVTITVAPQAPGAPTIGTATAGNASATVAFTAPNVTGGASITGYTVTSSGGQTATGPASPITVTGLANGTAYTFTVKANNAAGSSAASAASNSVTPIGTQTISFANPGNQSFTTPPVLSATSSSGLAVSFISVTTPVCTVTAAGVLTFVSPGTCAIIANQAGNAAYAAAPAVVQDFLVYGVVPGVPTIGTATAGNATATVSFTAPNVTGGEPIVGYTVTSSGGQSTSGTASPITVIGLANGTAYTFTVKASNSVGSSAASAASNSVTPMGTQTISFANPGAQGLGTSVNLSAASSSGLAVSFSSATPSVCTVTAAGGLSLVATGTCTISADQAGNAAYAAAPTVTQSFPVNAVVPGAPTIGTATAGNASATVAFTAPNVTGGAPITGYTVTSSGGQSASGTASPITVTGLANGTAYTFTVKASNAAGTGPASAASNSVTPADNPPVALAVAATVAYSSSDDVIALNLSGGGASSVAIASAPAHGRASALGMKITYTPNTGYAGTDSFTYTASNAGGTSAAATITITVAPQPPSVANISMKVLANSSDNLVPLKLSGGSASAVKAGTPAHGTVSISGLSIRYTPTSGYVGTDSFTYVASNAGGDSAPGTVTIEIKDRPDPSKDSEVTGLLNAQASFASQFAQTQITNFEGHLERLHSLLQKRDPLADKSQDGRVGTDAPTPRGKKIAAAAAASSGSEGTDKSVQSGTASSCQLKDAVACQIVANSSPESAKVASVLVSAAQAGQSGSGWPWHSIALDSNPSAPEEHAFGIWSAGTISVGKQGTDDLHLHSSGVSVGIDWRVAQSLVVGWGAGFGHEKQDIGSSGSLSTADGYSMELYESFSPAAGVYVDGLLGYSHLSFDGRRYVGDLDSFASSERDGAQWFASLTGAYEFRQARLLLAPYGRLDLVRTRLNSSTEQGADLYDLIYFDQTIPSTKFSLGMRGETEHVLGSGVARPYFRVEYQFGLDNPGVARMAYADDPSTVYQYALTNSERRALVLGLGASYTHGKTWKTTLSYRYNQGSESTRIHSLGLIFEHPL